MLNIRKSYPIAADSINEETVVERSRFICYLAPCTSTDEARQQVKKYQAQHPQASHHCYAYVSAAADDSQHYGFSDDGEPSGTAGKPMLSMLQGSGIGQVCAVVVRYFGGTKLGTGGLQRAYGLSVRNALEHLPSKIQIPMVDKRLPCQYTQVNDVMHLLELAEGKVIEQNYGEQVDFILSIPDTQLVDFSEKLKTMSAGQLVLQKL